jgi:hypothetical protein
MPKKCPVLPLLLSILTAFAPFLANVPEHQQSTQHTSADTTDRQTGGNRQAAGKTMKA